MEVSSSGRGSTMSGRGGTNCGRVADHASSSSSPMPPINGSLWRPSNATAFHHYNAEGAAHGGSSGSFSRRVGNKSLVVRLTENIVETFHICNPDIKCLGRFLTNPSAGMSNNGLDNENSDLILYANLVLINKPAQRRYLVRDILGQGTFGQVVKCWDVENLDYVAVKVIKNHPAYFRQALVEVSILRMLNQTLDACDGHHIVRFIDYFVHQQHLCIAFELLGPNLYEIIEKNHHEGFPLRDVQSLSRQILDALILLKNVGIIHCDMKPENILVDQRVNCPEIKVIDFGSACKEGHTIYSYIQSRYYRSPEVLLGYPYTTAIDMWSFGCIIAELFLGYPLFPGASEFDLLRRMIEILGYQPPDDMLMASEKTNKFFKHVGNFYVASWGHNDGSSVFRVMTKEEYELREGGQPVIGRQYFHYKSLEDIVSHYPLKESSIEAEEISLRLSVLDLLRGLFQFDPAKRWSPLEVSRHPFITGEPFIAPYAPTPKTARSPIFRAATVDHHPGGGHWLATGLSPQVANVRRYFPPNSRPFPKAPVSFGSSYGSFGSLGSYNDSVGPRSYGSYGSMNGYHFTSDGFDPYSQVGGSYLGSSPNIRIPPLACGDGVSSGPGVSGSMYLGTSPSNYMPPNLQLHTSNERSNSSCPSSTYGSSLGKATNVGHHNKRRNLCHLPLPVPPHECSGPQHGHGVYGDGTISSHPDSPFCGYVGYSQNMFSKSCQNCWRPSASGLSSGSAPVFGAFSAPFVHDIPNLRCVEMQNNIDWRSSIPDPADWDPNYSDESLLEEEHPDVGILSLEFNNAIQLGSTSDNVANIHGHNHGNTIPSHFSTNQRTNEQFPAYSFLGNSQSTAYSVPNTCTQSSWNQVFVQAGQQVDWRPNGVDPIYMQSYQNLHNVESMLVDDATGGLRLLNNAIIHGPIHRGERMESSVATDPYSNPRNYAESSSSDNKGGQQDLRHG